MACCLRRPACEPEGSEDPVVMPAMRDLPRTALCAIIVGMKIVLTAIVALLGMLAVALAAGEMTAEEAYSEIGAGKMVLVDVRTPAEWKDTGIAPGAVTLSMGSKDFAKKLKEIVEANPGKKIGLICASGGRSTAVQKQMEKLGIGDAVDISEGMKGNGSAPGWIARGLPVKPYE
jgi:rhodanese-related sulfurtransferase